ncbi:DUF938 domain-containing protein [Romeria aff. gracilis LEGE 07310]|uniref:DUF938 domain-containing protein n=1 Tax=Vasconcelosia minhoensis LEGE 07310 TaxID=915328 RepID=A0A8J7AQR1_9CYAN|nr:DUF938 domain-containing protein [Romeria gracilis]MBE9078706.1 DUF938 domain-containing protein [Romeria aff. gracilis LEGE 07310]
MAYFTEKPDDARQYAAAPERNQQPILEVLQQQLPRSGTVLEVASGTGQHALFLAPRLAPRHWLPSDPNPVLRQSIRAWAATAPTPTLHPPLDLDVQATSWPVEDARLTAGVGPVELPPICAIAAINLIHISPWAACLGLLAGAQRILPPGGILYLYGPYRQNGQHTGPSNAAFDAMLQQQNSDWGVRDLETVQADAAKRGLQPQAVIPMPAYNLSVIFTRTS